MPEEPPSKKRRSVDSSPRPVHHSPRKGLRLILTEERVVEFKEQLDKIVKQGDQNHKALEILRALETLKAVNLDILRKTQIGWVVNDLRKNSKDPEVVRLSKDILKTWKKVVPESEDNRKRKSSSD